MSANRWPSSLFAAVLLSAGCAGRFDPAHFDGSRAPRRAEPEAILELAAGTDALETIGSVRASCTLKPGFRRLDDEVLSDLDCSPARLLRVLRESAAGAGGEVLISTRCRSRRQAATPAATYQVSCAAQVARYRDQVLTSGGPLRTPRSLLPATPAPSASDMTYIDEPDASLASRIRLHFEPLVAAFAGRPRAGAEVRELAELPLADRRIGDLAASCDGGCDARALRYGVLIAAGRLGVPEVVDVRCFRSGLADACVGTLAAPERDE